HSALPNAKLVARPSLRAAVEDLCTQQADAAFLDEFTASTVLLGGLPCSNQPLRVIRMPMLETELGVGSTLEASAVADELRRGIDQVTQDGDVPRILSTSG